MRAISPPTSSRSTDAQAWPGGRRCCRSGRRGTPGVRWFRLGFRIYGDYSEPNPPARILDALASDSIDVAIVRAPLAGYFAPRLPVTMDIVPVQPQVDLPFTPFVYDMAVGVRRGDSARLHRLEAALSVRDAEIAAVLAEYNVPIVQQARWGR
jgi:mxaJ protein